jgi:hypothetical protein
MANLQQKEAEENLAKTPIDIPTNFALKFVDTNMNKAITIEPDQPAIIILNLTKNIVTQVK